MKLLLLFAAVAMAVVGQEYDVVIHGGRLIDGTGNPSFLADIAIQDGKIARIGRLGEVHAKRVIDAKGLVVSPGFIDIHNHSDYTLITDGNAQSMIRQGVTSMILGEGGSAAPVGGKQEKSDSVSGWTDFDGYFSRLLKQGYFHQYRQLCRFEPDLDVCAWRACWSAYGDGDN